MSMNSTPSANRLHIGFFGRRNAGKSSVVNAVTDQSLAIVSDTKGTTTDPVYKAMEILPLGPVVIIDTPGYDDEGSLGELRVKRTRQVLNKTDVAVLVVDATEGIGEWEEELISLFRKKAISFIVVYNKSDLLDEGAERKEKKEDHEEIYVSALTKAGIHELKEMIGRATVTDTMTMKLIGDLVKPLDTVVLVIPIDESAPKGRIILPQQQALRDLLEAGAISVVCRETELEDTLKKLDYKVDLVVTDSQAFQLVSKIVPDDILLTSFSILMARYKGFLNTAVNGCAALKNLKDGDKILISEGCTHHRQCNDIGTVKIPGWLKKLTGKVLDIETSSGIEFPEDLSPYSMIIHCGGCMLNEREMKYRMRCAVEQGIPFTNYGTFIASVNGILDRSLKVIPDLDQGMPTEKQ